MKRVKPIRGSSGALIYECPNCGTRVGVTDMSAAMGKDAATPAKEYQAKCPDCGEAYIREPE